MEAVIVNYRSSRHRQYGNQMIILPEGSSSKEDAEKLIGKTATWSSSAGKELKGEIRSAHGVKGAVRVLFETGMPGQAVGSKIKIN